MQKTKIAKAVTEDLEGELTPQSIDEMLDGVDYAEDFLYVPTQFALEFVNFIKLVNDGAGEENLTPVLHLKILDTIATDPRDVCNLIFRGSGKTTLLAEYLFLFIAVYGELPILGKVDLAIYVSDSIDNGIANMKKNLEHRYNNSDFLQRYIKANLTQTRWEFTALDGRKFIVKGYGAATGVRGTKELGKRPQLAVLDDLMSDEAAKSPAIMASIRDTIEKAVEFALHPTRRRVIWSGTPFNANDPLHTAVESGAYAVNVFPVCNEFPVSREEFTAAWPDRFTYDSVLKAYDKARKLGNVAAFYQELMLRIRNEADALINDDMLIWYDLKMVLQNKSSFNFYITTDFATSAKESADYSVIMVWAYSSNGDWLLVDGICERQTMDKNIDSLFRLVQQYSPQSVGVEISGQQGAFLAWIREQMVIRNIFFNIAKEKGKEYFGIRPSGNKFERFNLIVPWFHLGKLWFPTQLKNTKLLVETLVELRMATVSGFKSKHDDCIDGISQLQYLSAWQPSESFDNLKVSGRESHDVQLVRDIWADAEFSGGNTASSGLDTYIC